MAQEPPRFASILCAVDGSEAAAVAVEQAVTLAGADGRLTFLSVSDPSGAPVAAVALAPALRAAALAGIATESLILHATDVHEAILAVAADHDLLVLGAHGRHRRADRLLGSASSAALYHSPAPVLVARPAPEHRTFPRAVLLATDATPETDEAVAVTAALAPGMARASCCCTPARPPRPPRRAGRAGGRAAGGHRHRAGHAATRRARPPGRRDRERAVQRPDRDRQQPADRNPRAGKRERAIATTAPCSVLVVRHEAGGSAGAEPGDDLRAAGPVTTRRIARLDADEPGHAAPGRRLPVATG